MADSTISQLPVALSVTASDYFPVDQGGVTKRATLALLGNGAVFITTGKFLYVTNTLTLSGTDGTTITFPTTSATIARTDAAQTFTGVQTFSSTIVGNIDTATALQTARTIDGVSFDGTANILVIAPATHAAPNKATPVAADEFPVWDSVTGLLNNVTWANLQATEKTYFDTIYAALAGLATQTFSVAAATSAAHAVRLDQMPQYPFRNRLINGDFSVSQINGSSAVTVTAAAALLYVIDQWYAYCTGANVSGQRVAGSGQDQYRYQFTGAASVTAIGFAQRIEQSASYDMNGQSTIISVDMSNSLLTSVTYTVNYANTADTFGTLASPTVTQIATGAITVSSTLTRFYIPVSIPAAATTGIEIVFSVGAQTSGTWVIGNVQHEVVASGATVGTSYERLPFETQLRRCRRYLPVFTGTNGQFVANGMCYSATAAFCGHQFDIRTRIAVTGVSYNTAVFALTQSSSASVATTGIAIASGGTTGVTLLVTGASGLTAGDATALLFGTTGTLLYYTGAQL